MLQLRATGQAFSIANYLHRACANPCTARRRSRNTVALKQGAHDTDRKTITRPNSIDDLSDRHGGYSAATGLAIVKVGAKFAQLDDNALGT